jgi:TrmH RNA methyltransferase
MINDPETPPLSRDDLAAWAQSGKAGLILHAVGNDHNLGAIARSAAFFDAPWLIITEEERAAALTTSAYRVAEGGLEHVTVRTIRSTAAFLRDASRSLITIGAEGRSRQRIGDLPRLLEVEAAKSPKSRGVAIVLGNEETGLPQEVKEACSYLVRIPGTGLMESLNVAQAATLFLQRIYEG